MSWPLQAVMDRVGAGADEGLDPQVLFEGFEEELDLPALLVDRRDRRRRQVREVGQQHERRLLVLKLDFDPAISAGNRATCHDRLEHNESIAPDLAFGGGHPRLHRGVIGILLQARDKPDLLFASRFKQPVINVATVIARMLPGGGISCWAILDLAQRLRLCQLAKAHRYELFPATEALRAIFRCGAPHRRFEIRSIQYI